MDQGVAGASPPIVRVYFKLLKIAESVVLYPRSRTNVLVKGEIGSGKSLLAVALSKIAKRDNVHRINCGSFPTRSLLGSELFGHVKGAYTDAGTERTGLLETARHGTVVLDDIDKMPLDAQGFLLGVLNEGQYRKLGDDATRTVEDVFFVATTNADLDGLANKGEFLPDLLSRLNAQVQTPSLKEQIQDVPLLVKHFLEPYAGSEADKYRFPIAEWCAQQVEAGHIESIRQLGEHLIPELVRHLDGGMSPIGSPELQAIRDAVKKAVRDGRAPPVSQAEVARQLDMPRQTLQDGQWRPAVERAQKEGLIRKSAPVVRSEQNLTGQTEDLA